MYPCRTEYTNSSWSQLLNKENKLQIVPHSLQLRKLALLLLSTGESDQTLTQWTVHTKDIGLFTIDFLIHTSPQLHTVHTKGFGLFSTICLIHQNPQPHCTLTLTPFPPLTLLAYHSSLPPET